MSHITTDLIKSVYLAKLDMHAETGQRIEITPSIIENFEKLGGFDRNRIMEKYSTLPASILEQNFKRACEFSMMVFINDDLRDIVNGVLVDHNEGDFDEIFKEMEEIAKDDDVWEAASGFYLMVDAIKEHPYFYLKG